MRIISQDGRLDIPYEQVIIQCDDTTIYYFDGGKNIPIAKYSTKEMLDAVMEFIRNCYMLSTLNEKSPSTAKFFEDKLSPEEKCGVCKLPEDEDDEINN